MPSDRTVLKNLSPPMGGTKVIERKTVFHSRLPIYVFFDFYIQKSKISRRHNKCPTKTQSLLSRNTWESILLKPVPELPSNYISLEESRNSDFTSVSHNQRDGDGDEIMTTENDLAELDDMSDFDSYNKKDDDDDVENHNTILVYHSSFSINSGPTIPMASRILSACVIKSKISRGDDTLMLYLANGECLLIKFQNTPQRTHSFYIVEKTIIPVPRQWTPKHIVISNKNDVIIISSEKVGQVWDIVYSKKNLPTIRHRFNITGESFLNFSTVSVSQNQDAFLTTNYASDIVQLECLNNFGQESEAKRLVRYMKNTFETPLIILPLESTHGALLLQQTGYSVKPVSFFIGGDDMESHTCSYPAQKTTFRLNSTYIPQRMISTTQFDNPTGATHDQVLISTSNNYVYVLDVYYDAKRHTYTSSMKPLFKYKHTMSFFKFEVRDDMLYDFIFANEMGITESKIVKIVEDSGRPILKTVTTIWSEIHPYPMMDFAVVPSPYCKRSIEDQPQEFWALTGVSANHSLMSIKRGYKGKQLSTNTEKIFGAEKVFALKDNHVWVSTRACNYIYRFDVIDKVYRKAAELLPNSAVIHLQYHQSVLLAITSNCICLIDSNYDIVECMEFPYQVTLATSLNGTVTIIYLDEAMNSCIAAFEILISITENVSSPSPINPISLNIVLNNDQQPTCLKMFQDHNRKACLFVGFADQTCLMSIIENGEFTEPIPLSLDFGGENKIRKEHQSLVSEVLFKPYDIACIDEIKNTYILTSIDGEFLITNIAANDKNKAGKTFVTQQRVKVSDESPLDIILSSKPGLVYLKGKFVWRLDVDKSRYPLKVLFEDSACFPISCCAFDSETRNLVLVKNHVLTLAKISDGIDSVVKSRRIGITCMKLHYFSYYDLLVMIPMPDLTPSPPLVFAESRAMRFLKDLEIGKCFMPDEKALCLCEWRVKRSGSVYVNLVVGGRSENGGFIKVINISKDGSSYSVKCTSTFKEDGPITHLECLNLKDDSLIFGSFDNNIVKYACNISEESQKMSRKEIVLSVNDPIKKFSINVKPKSLLIDVYIVIRTNYIVKAQYYESISAAFFMKTDICSDFSSDILNLDSEVNILADFHHQSLTIKHNLSSELGALDVGYFPRLAAINSPLPWIPLSKRTMPQFKNFLTVGLNGEVDYYEVREERREDNGQSDSDKGDPLTSDANSDTLYI